MKELIGKNNAKWVVKQDGMGLHLHVAKSIQFIHSDPSQLPPTNMTKKDATYFVREFREPWLGKGNYNRKAEVRVPLAITSTSPL